MSPRARLLLVFLLLLGGAYALGSWQLAVHDPRSATGERGIAMISADWCGYCRAQEAQLATAQVDYRRIDADSNEGQLAMIALGARGVPVTIVGQVVLRGYDPDRLRVALAPLGYRLP